MFIARSVPAVLLVALLAPSCAHDARPAALKPDVLEPVVLEPVVLNGDGGWCWFQDERALALGDWVIFGSVASGRTDPERRGDVELTAWNPSSGELRIVELHHQLDVDDHAAPALVMRPDGRLLAMYASHGHDRVVRWRISERAGDPTDLGPEQTLDVEGAQNGVTYSNLHMLRNTGTNEARLINLYRGAGWDPGVLTSGDAGETWEIAGSLLQGPGRPYLKYANDGHDRIHFVATEQHPRDFDNSLYHGVLRGTSVLRSDGTVAGALGTAAPGPEDLTRIFQGRADAVAWPVDIDVFEDGHAVVLFSVQRDGAGMPRREGGQDHRLHLARWDGERWLQFEIAHAGTSLYAGEDDYTGLAALDPADPAVVYLSTNADPESGEPLISAADGERHHELFRGTSEDGGETFQWTALTHDSTSDQLRPIVPRGTPRVLLWLRGELRTYTDYDLEVVGSRIP